MATLKNPCLKCNVHLSGVSKKRHVMCMACNDRVDYDRNIAEIDVQGNSIDPREPYALLFGGRSRVMPLSKNYTLAYL